MMTDGIKMGALFRNTVVPRYLPASELVKAGTRCILMRKTVSALATCSPLVALARTFYAFDKTIDGAPQEKALHLLSPACHLWERINDKYRGVPG